MRASKPHHLKTNDKTAIVTMMMTKSETTNQQHSLAQMRASLTGQIKGRGCLAVTGDEAEAFLNDLLTLDITTLAPETVASAALLTPQGRILFDLLISLITHDRHGFRLECDLDRRDDLLKKLRLYRLRRAVDFTATDEHIHVALNTGEAKDKGYKDLRFADHSICRYYTAGHADNDHEGEADHSAYRAYRYRHVIPEGQAELPSEKALPLEAGLDKHGAVSFDKGCFIGQEVTARTRYRGLLKRRYTAFAALAAITYPADIRANDRLVGEVLGCTKDGDGWIGLANIRIDALSSGQPLIVESQQIIPITADESTT